jgi:hypothetical protein
VAYRFDSSVKEVFGKMSADATAIDDFKLDLESYRLKIMAHLSLMLDEHHERLIHGGSMMMREMPNRLASRPRSNLVETTYSIFVANFGTNTAVPKPSDLHPHPDKYLTLSMNICARY